MVKCEGYTANYGIQNQNYELEKIDSVLHTKK